MGALAMGGHVFHPLSPEGMSGLEAGDPKFVSWRMSLAGLTLASSFLYGAAYWAAQWIWILLAID